MTDTLQRAADAASRYGTFEIHPNSLANSATYCPMCGGEVDRNGDCTGGDTHDREQVRLAIQAIQAMARWAIHERVLLRVLSVKVEQPTLTVREVATLVGCGKSQADDYLRRIGEIFPVLRPVLGLESPKARAQRARRAKGQTNNEGKGA